MLVILHHNFTPPKALTWTTFPKRGKSGYQLAVYYEIHIFLLQKLVQGRLNYILTKKIWIKCFKFNQYPVFSLLGEVDLLNFIYTLQKEQSCNEESFV